MKKMYPKLKRDKKTYTQWVKDRIVGCQSTNHSSCKGELWECERCHKIICWEEGSTDLIDICDDCWYDIRILEKNDYLTSVERWERAYHETT